MCAAAAVRVDDNLAARDAGIPVGASDNELARGIDMKNIVIANQLGQAVVRTLQTRLHARDEDRTHILTDALLHHALGLLLGHTVAGLDELVMLCRHDDRMYTHGLVRYAVILHRHLTLGIGTQIGHRRSLASYYGQLLEYYVREDQRSGHVLARLVAGVTEHYTLIARALLVGIVTHNTLIDIGRLLVDCREYAARSGVELILAAIVTYAIDDAAHDTLYVDIRLRTHLARHHYKTRGAERLARHLRLGVVTQKFIEDSIRNLIRHLVGVPFRDRFRSKQIISHTIKRL